jgi:hypothetical protein
MKVRRILFYFFFCIVLSSCDSKSPEKLSSKLIDAINKKDTVMIEKLLQNGADPYLKTKDGIVPFKLALQKTMLSTLSGSDSNVNKEMLILIGYHGRRINRKEIITQGTLSMNLEMVSLGQMVAHTTFKTEDAKYELEIGGFETKLIGIDNNKNQLVVRTGGSYKVIGTLADSKTIEVDSLEYINGGTGSFTCPITNYLPSTWSQSGF